MSQFRKIVESILQEAKQVGTLYHATTLKGLINILQTDTIKSSLETGISFTRNKNFINNEKWDNILNNTSKEYLDTPQKVLEYGKKYIKTMYPNLPIIENK